MPVALFGAAAALILGLWAGTRVLGRYEREGHWDKEGHGPQEHQESGVKFRSLEVPPSDPFD